MLYCEYEIGFCGLVTLSTNCQGNAVGRNVTSALYEALVAAAVANVYDKQVYGDFPKLPEPVGGVLSDEYRCSR
jgi:hypothetical protein